MATLSSRPRILDCTLRDGGFYTDWTFDAALVRDLIAALDAAGVDLIELGYRSRAPRRADALFRHCDEARLADLLPPRAHARLAFMIDAKEFIDGGQVDTAALAATIPSATDSIFSWCRVATMPATVAEAATITRWLAARGLRTAINLMGVAAIDDNTLGPMLAHVADAAPDVVYLADSFGSLTPARAGALVERVRSGHDGPIGVHFHDNLGLALANALAAIGHGAAYVDSSLAGMGRGAGNVRTEQLVAMLGQHHRELDPTALVSVLERHLLPLQRQHGWGPGPDLFLSSPGDSDIDPLVHADLALGLRQGRPPAPSSCRRSAPPATATTGSSTPSASAVRSMSATPRSSAASARRSRRAATTASIPAIW